MDINPVVKCSVVATEGACEKEEKEKDLNSLRQTIQALKRLFSTELKTLQNDNIQLREQCAEFYQAAKADMLKVSNKVNKLLI